ncbi:tripartite tricarboxylate transporter substrate binding protein [Pigmentiphaga sp. H8]|uniref:Bug family tripartite tricarboxylate transporter substrate binding protein n=1 Tax=Pigmentiphaga sp. H8 TaxID=2488560 RepID=UPI000F5A2986|nr:tripartite tricarboxylate transporter substrate binding protein [Pigmentiphaga sp. H8]AZG10734.1 tripartite tricarboxylate transporter substrate binding protein [Pigmentiphaga sp. H8]
MSPFRRSFIPLLAVAGLSAGTASAQDTYPSRPVRIVVTLSAGSQVDILARLVGEKLGQSLGQPVIVENRPGAGGTLAAAFVAAAAPDGYTLLMTANGHAINPALYDKLRFDTAKDFRGVSLVAVVPSVLVTSPGVPATNVSELIALLKANPGKYNYASPGVGSAGHMATELFNLDAKVEATHVPYKGTPEALTDLMGGNVQYFFAPLGATLPLVNTGKVKALAVSTAARSPALPNTPTVAESGLPGFQYDFWYGLVAPAATPKPVIERLASDIQKALQSQDVKEKLAAQGAAPSSLTDTKFDQFLHSEIRKSAELVRISGAANALK